MTCLRDLTTVPLLRLHLVLAQSQSVRVRALWLHSLLARRLAQGARGVDRALRRENQQARQFLRPICPCPRLCLRPRRHPLLPPLRPNELRKRRQSCKLEVLSDARACQQSTRRNPCPTTSRPCLRLCTHPRHHLLHLRPRVLQSLPWLDIWRQQKRVEKRRI